MSERWPGGLISRSAPAVVGPTDGEGGSAPGIWTINQIAPYVKAGTWPLPVPPRQLWTWGYNAFGQLGLNNTTYYSSPKQVGALTTWLNITGGLYYTAAIKTDGTLWTWGQGTQGQLGQNDTVYKSSPTQVGALTTWSKVACASYATVVIKTDGTLWSWGLNNYGQLGQNISYNISRSSPVQIGALTTWSKVGATRYSVYAIKTDGTLWAWGWNIYGQLGDGTTTNRSSPVQVGALTTWSTIAGGENHVLAIKTDGTLWSWGLNNKGQLGLNISYTTNRSSPVQVGALTTWSKVSATETGSAAIKTDGTLWSWGNGAYGQSGLGNTTNYSSPNQVGALTTWSKIGGGSSDHIAIKTDGTLWSWGLNDYGQLGIGNTTNFSIPVQVGGLTTWNNVFSAKGPFSLAVKS